MVDCARRVSLLCTAPAYHEGSGGNALLAEAVVTLGYSFQPVDVDLPEHPRVKTIAKRYRRAALGLYVAGLCYARKHTPGLVPMCFVEDDDPKLVEELVRVGLWVPLGEVGWEIFNWEKKSGRGSTGAERTKRWREKQRAAVNDAEPFVGPPTRAECDASHVTGRDVTVTRHRVTVPSPSLSSSDSSGSDQGGAGGDRRGSIRRSTRPRCPPARPSTARPFGSPTTMPATPRGDRLELPISSGTWARGRAVRSVTG